MLVVILGILGGDAVDDGEGGEDIALEHAAQLAEALAANPAAAVLDVRGAGEFAADHVKGAVNIAYTRLAARISEVPNGSPLFIHCGSGLRAAFATSFLAVEGHEVVYVNGSFGEISAGIRK